MEYIADAPFDLANDWDRYEAGYLASVERWAAAHPAEQDVEGFLATARASRHRFEHGGRKHLGFGIYLFVVPARSGVTPR